MAKKIMTPEEYTEKQNKKAAKRKKFFDLFIKTLALCISMAIVFATTVIATKRVDNIKANLSTGNDAQTDGNNDSDSSDDDLFGNDNADDNASLDDNTSGGSNNSGSSEDSSSGGNSSSGGDSSGGAQDGQQNVANILTSKQMQFDLFVKSFKAVKTNAKSATIVKKNAYNHKNHVEAGALSAIGETLMNSFLKEEEPNTTYTGADIATNFPPANANCGLKTSDIENIKIKEDGNYYIIEVYVKAYKNPKAGEHVGAIASIITQESIYEPISKFPGLNNLTPSCNYETTKGIAKIEKASGNMVEYYFDLPMILVMANSKNSYEIGLGFEEWWTIAY